jgi:hypothetical protein
MSEQMNEQQQKAEQRKEEQQWKEQQNKERNNTAIFIGFLALVLFILWLISFRHPVEGVKVNTVQGITVFAIFYFIAQLIERIVELFSNLPIFGKPIQIDQYKLEADLLEAALKEKLKTKSFKDLKEETKELTIITRNKDCLERPRVIRLWALSSFLGILFSYFFVGLLNISGISIPHIWDSLFSGIMLGGGTKPLHDLIGYIEKK